MEIAFIFIIIHTVADFIFQAEDWAVNKSKYFLALIRHTSTYSIVTMVLLAMVLPTLHPEHPWEWYVVTTFLFGLITFILHTLTDFISSKIVEKKFTNKEYYTPIPNLGAFTIIQFDQVAHYAQLFLTYYLLTL